MPMSCKVVGVILWIGTFLFSASIGRASEAVAPAFKPAPCAFKDVEPDWAERNHVECGWLRVPESRGKRGSRMLKLWIAIARADAATKREDPILYIHGGPGNATVDYVFPYFPQSKTWPGFRATRDIIFFDQRGSGRSEPEFCAELATTLEAIDRAALPAREGLARAKAAFGACRERMLAGGFDFGAYHSRAIVEDAEDLRRALDVRKWNVYAISYGTLVGLEYLRSHPDGVRAAILDSVFPPNSPNGAEQISSTAKAYEALQRACAVDESCAKRFPDILTTLAGVTRRLDAAPLTNGGRRITGTNLSSALWTMLVSSQAAPWVPLAIDRAAKGDAAAIRGIVKAFGASDAFGSYSTGQAWTINCYEVQTGNTAAIRRDMMRRYPQLVGDDEIAEATDELCATWQTDHAPIAHYAPVSSSIPVLLYGGEFDPATPYDDALLAARHLENGTPVFVRGASHGAFYQDDCTRGIAHAFLGDPDTPPDLGCLAKRPATRWPTSGLDAFLKST